MEMSSDIKELATAFSKAQATVEGAAKDSSNPHFKNKYADLSSVWSACRDALTKNGLSVVQFPGELIDNRMTMTTMLMHSSGQWMRETLSIPLSKVDAQGYGSATTYARRYALAAVVGVCPEDDDGNAASQGAPARQNGTQQQAPQGKITAQQRVELEMLIRDVGASEGAFLDYIKVEKLEDIRAANFDQAKRALEAKRQRKAA